MKRVYLSGPMTGIVEYNFPAVHAAAGRLRGIGLEVVNPAEINVPPGAVPWDQCLRNDIKQLCDCDAIVLMPGWEYSKGTHLELHIAHRVGMHIAFLDHVLSDRSMKMSKVEIDGVSFDVAPKVAALLQAVSEERDELKDANRVTAREAVFGFVAWLTYRKEPITLSYAHNCAEVVHLAATWCEGNNLPPIREDVFPANIVHPGKTPNTLASAVEGALKSKGE